GLVRGAGAPDEIPDRDRLRPGGGRVRARLRRLHRHRGPDRARASLGPHRARVGVDARVRRLRALVRAAPGDAGPADAGAALPDGRRAGCSRLRPGLGFRRDSRGDLPGTALRADLRHAQPDLDHRRRERPLAHRGALRPHRRLRARILAVDRRQRRLRRGDLAGRTGTRAGGCGACSPRFIVARGSYERASMSTIDVKPLTGSAAWHGRDLARSTDSIRRISAAAVAELDAALASVKARGLAWADITREDFPLARFGAELAAVAHELEHGRGLVLLRGLPVARYTE